VVAQLELPKNLAQLKTGLPAGHLGSNHFALGAKLRIADSLEDDEEAVVEKKDDEDNGEVDTTGMVRYFLPPQVEDPDQDAAKDQGKGLGEDQGKYQGEDQDEEPLP
ncbi:hypothetical protein BGZ70_006703, partial [Mortierella alpina]